MLEEGKKYIITEGDDKGKIVTLKSLEEVTAHKPFATVVYEGKSYFEYIDRLQEVEE